MLIDAVTLEINIKNSKKRKKERKNVLCDPDVPLLSLCPEDLTFYPTGACSVMFIDNLLTIARK